MRKKFFIFSSFIILFILSLTSQTFSQSTFAINCNFTVNSGSITNGYKFWKAPQIPANYYQCNLSITSSPGGNWALYIANSSGIITDIALNRPENSYNFSFSIPTSDSRFPDGGGYRFRLTAQGNPNNIWCESSQFYISSLPSLTVNLNTPSPLIVGNTAQVSWSTSGGIPGLPNGGWTGNIHLQWYQGSTGLQNFPSEIAVSQGSTTVTVPDIGTIPSSNFKIGGSNADVGTSIPAGYVSAFTSNFTINYPPPPAPTLLSPSQYSTVSTSTITFQWSNTNALRYELYVDNNSGLGSAEISKFQIDTLANFTGTSYTISGNWLEENVYYWRVIAVYANNITAQSSLGSFTYSPTKLPSPNWVPIYRAYLSSVDDHFYCTSVSHLATAILAGYNFEKVEGFISLDPFNANGNLKSVFRFYLSAQSSHLYTTNPVTKDSLIAAGSNNKYEGITGYTYGANQADKDLVKLYYTFKGSGHVDYFYTTSEIEKNNSIQNGYQNRGFIAYVSLEGNEETESWMDMQPLFGYGINPQNGNFGNYTKSSFDLPCVNSTLSFTHLYNSFSTRLMSPINPLGSGWTHNFAAYVFQHETRIYVFWPGGSINVYNSSDLKSTTPGVYDILTKVSSTRFQIKKKDQMTYTFDILNASTDSTAFLKFIKDRNDNTITCNYDVQARKLLSVSTTEGRVLNFEYSSVAGSSELITKITDPSINRSIKFEYDQDKNLIKFTDAKNQITQYEYDPNARYDHLIKTITFPKGNKITNVFNGKKVVTQQVGGNQLLNIAYNQNVNQNVATITQTGGTSYTANYQPGVFGSITQLSSSSGNSNYEYNDVLNKTLPTKITDGRGFISTFTYDVMGNPTQINKPMSAVHQFIYNTFNDVTKYTDPRGKVTNYGYDLRGNKTSIQTPRGTTGFTYNLNGTISTSTDPVGLSTSFSYNNFGNVTSVIKNGSNSTLFSYDPAGRRLSTTDPNQKISSYAYDNNNLILSFTNADGNTANYSYDQNDNNSSVTDPKGQITTMNYNSMDLLQSKSNPLSQQQTFDYYDNTLLKTKTKADGQSLNFNYDNSNRLISVSGAITKNVAYDNNDNISSASNGNENLVFSYDGLNRITSYTDYYFNTVSYVYDVAGNITSLTYPGNKVVTYTYDDDNLLHSVQDWNNNTTTYSYRNDGSIQQILYPNGTKKIYTYDALSRVTKISITKSTGSIIAEYNFTLDNVGNQTAVSQTEPFNSSILVASSKQYTYNAANRLTSDSAYTYGYDANGNLTSKNGSTSNSYSFDGENRLTSMSGDYSASFTYDVFGNRRSSSINGSIKKYVLDINSSLPKVLMETDNNGNVLNYYVYGLELISRIKPDNTTNYYHSDFRGSVIALTDAAQNITHKYSYGPYGEVLQSSEANANPFKYVGTGGVMDEGFGLYFIRARFYDPKNGRFISEDPVWDMNLYAYGKDNPMLNTDLSGLTPSKAEANLANLLKAADRLNDAFEMLHLNNIPGVKRLNFIYSIFQIVRFKTEKKLNPGGKTTDSSLEIFKASASIVASVATLLSIPYVSEVIFGSILWADFVQMQLELAPDYAWLIRITKQKIRGR